MRYNHATLFAAVAAAVPDRDGIIFRDRRLTYAQVADRVNRLANLLLAHGVTVERDRAELEPWESGQGHVGLYLQNGNEYVEGMLGSATARAASFNVNYRYVADELAYLLDDASARAIIFHARFAPTLAAVLPSLRTPPALLLQVADESGNALVPGALDYEEALAASSPAAPATAPDPDDLYLLYTGGTTGMPKGTTWTQAEMLEGTIPAFLPEGLFGAGSLEEGVRMCVEAEPRVVMPIPPLIHGAAQWLALSGILAGGTVVFPDVVDRFDAASVLTAIDAHGVQIVNMVGNVFAKPLCEELERGGHSGRSLLMIGSGGAVLTAAMKDRLLRLLPHLAIVDVAGSSESGSQLTALSTGQAPAVSGVFSAVPGSCVVDADMTRFLGPGDPAEGWLGRYGAIPLGYLGDPEKTARTFREIEGRRVVLPGDRARHLADGTVELLGRDSVTINTGGEKVFAEEVESALADHPAVRDVVVVGRPSEQWGSEVVAVVQIAPQHEATDEELVAHAAQRIARYKLPKAIVRVDSVLRSPAGKADYRWARDIAASSVPSTQPVTV